MVLVLKWDKIKKLIVLRLFSLITPGAYYNPGEDQ